MGESNPIFDCLSTNRTLLGFMKMVSVSVLDSFGNLLDWTMYGAKIFEDKLSKTSETSGFFITFQ